MWFLKTYCALLYYFDDSYVFCHSFVIIPKKIYLQNTNTVIKIVFSILILNTNLFKNEKWRFKLEKTSLIFPK